MNSTRRTFLRNSAGAFAAGALNGAPMWPAFRYVTAAHAINVWMLQRSFWTKLQTVPSRSPVAPTFHPSRRFLYVANEIDEHERLPRGTVEAYAIHPQSGRLSLLTRQPLSLSATMPRGLALSPDGRYLVVAAYGGGSYNVLPVEPSGALGQVSSIFKDVGSGVHSECQAAPHPHSLTYDATGRYLLASDFGCDRISVFRIVDGALRRDSRLQIAAGSGPGPLAFDASGTRLQVRNTLRKSTCYYAFDPVKGRLNLVS